MTPRLFALIAGGEARKLMSYRVDFWINAVLVFFVELGVAFYVWSAVFSKSDAIAINGFTRDAMVIYYVLALLLGKIVLGHPREFTIARDIYDGGLTRYLLYPVNYFWFKYAEHLGGLLPALTRFVLCGGVAVIWLAGTPGLVVSPASLGMGAISVAVATLLHFLILFAIEGVAFWADNTWTLIVGFNFVSSLLGGLLLPLELFPDRLQPVIEFLPFRHLVHAPISIVLGRVNPRIWAGDVVAALMWCAVIAVIARAVWRRGELRYSGVGI